MRRLTQEELSFLKYSQLKYSDIILAFEKRFGRIISKSEISYHKTKDMTPEQIKERHSLLSSTSGGNFKRVEVNPSIQIKIKNMCDKFKKPLEPFNIDKDIGNYLAGLYAGEGSFHVTMRNGKIPRFCCEIIMKEEKEFFEWLKYIWGGGIIYQDKRSGAYGFRIIRCADLLRKVIPVFETYPLRAKKQKQFDIWKIMMYTWFFRDKKEYAINDLIELRKHYCGLGRNRKY